MRRLNQRGNIPPDIIKDVLEQVNVLDIVSPHVKLKRMGQNHKGCCPFHQEKTPSFTVSESRQTYHCFGCGAHGNAITFMRNYLNYSFIEALQTLAKSVGFMLPDTRVERPSRNTSKLYEALLETTQFYQEQLFSHPQANTAKDYLLGRGLTPEIVNQYGLGYAPAGWENLYHFLSQKMHQRKDLVDAGLIIEKENSNKLYDRFRHRLMFPIRDVRGRVIGFGGRVLSDEDNPKYLNSPESPVFHKGKELYGLFEAASAIREQSCVLIVEGYMDVIALAQFNVNNAVATLGTATSGEHLKKLYQMTSNIVFCFDGDNAGQAAAWRALETILPFMKDERTAKFMFLPSGEDPDSLVRKQGQQSFQNRIKEATPLSVYLLDNLRGRFDTSNIDGRAQLANAAKPLIEKIPAGVLRHMILERLSQDLHMNVETLRQLQMGARPEGHDNGGLSKPRNQQTGYLRRHRQRHQGYENQNTNQSPTPRIRHVCPPIKLAISLLMQNPALHRLPCCSNFKPVADDFGQAILFELINLIYEDPEITGNEIVQDWPNPSQWDYLRELLDQKHDLPKSGVTSEFEGAMTRLTDNARNTQIKVLMDKLRDASITDDEKTLLNQLIKGDIPAEA